MRPVTSSLIVLNILVFLLQSVVGNVAIALFALWPIGQYSVSVFQNPVGFHWWQPLTAAFLHANLLHLTLNMYALFIFGNDVEAVMGSRYYGLLYFAALLSAAIAQLIVVTLTVKSGIYPTVGASGAIFGVLLAFGMLFPRRIVLPLIPPIPMSARIFVILYGIFELVNGIFGTEAGIAHFAHLGGMLGGYLVLLYWRKHTSFSKAYDE